MKKGILSVKIFVFSLLSLLATACLDNETDLVGYGDAYILVEMNGQDTVKGLGLHAYSYSDITSVTAILSGNSSVTYSLLPYQNYMQDYVYATPLSQYSKTLPATGTYVFNATFSNGQSLTFSDNLTSEYILPPQFTMCEWVSASQSLNLKWDAVENADVYNVKLVDSNNNVLFVSEALGSSTTSYSFGTDTQGWQSSASLPTNGQIVSAEIDAYLLDASSDNGSLQSVSKSRKTLTWVGQ